LNALFQRSTQDGFHEFDMLFHASKALLWPPENSYLDSGLHRC